MHPPHLQVVSPDSTDPIAAGLTHFLDVTPEKSIPFGPGAVWDGLHARFGFYVTDRPNEPSRPRAMNPGEERAAGTEFAIQLLNHWMREGKIVRAGTDHVYARP
jgi:hypothetical protein